MVQAISCSPPPQHNIIPANGIQIFYERAPEIYQSDGDAGFYVYTAQINHPFLGLAIALHYVVLIHYNTTSYMLSSWVWYISMAIAIVLLSVLLEGLLDSSSEYVDVIASSIIIDELMEALSSTVEVLRRLQWKLLYLY